MSQPQWAEEVGPTRYFHSLVNLSVQVKVLSLYLRGTKTSLPAKEYAIYYLMHVRVQVAYLLVGRVHFDLLDQLLDDTKAIFLHRDASQSSTRSFCQSV